jgi:hypothetical protein
MSMYGMVFGDGTFKAPMAAVAEVDPEKIGRLRDMWMEPHEDGGYRLAIYTRVGGNNRESYTEWVEYAQSHPNYISDRDDDFDNTYATYYFRITDAGVEAWAKWIGESNVGDEEPFTPSAEELWDFIKGANLEVVDTDKGWQEALARMGKVAGSADAG